MIVVVPHLHLRETFKKNTKGFDITKGMNNFLLTVYPAHGVPRTLFVISVISTMQTLKSYLASMSFSPVLPLQN